MAPTADAYLVQSRAYVRKKEEKKYPCFVSFHLIKKTTYQGDHGQGDPELEQRSSQDAEPHTSWYRECLEAKIRGVGMRIFIRSDNESGNAGCVLVPPESCLPLFFFC